MQKSAKERAGYEARKLKAEGDLKANLEKTLKTEKSGASKVLAGLEQEGLRLRREIEICATGIAEADKLLEKKVDEILRERDKDAPKELREVDDKLKTAAESIPIDLAQVCGKAAASGFGNIADQIRNAIWPGVYPKGTNLAVEAFDAEIKKIWEQHDESLKVKRGRLFSEIVSLSSPHGRSNRKKKMIDRAIIEARAV